MIIHTQLATQANLQKIKLFSSSYQPPVVKNEDVSMLKLFRTKWGEGISFPFVSYPHTTTDHHLFATQSEKLMDFLKVRKCGMLCVNFRSVAANNSSVMEFWPLSIEQRTKLFLKLVLVVLSL